MGNLNQLELKTNIEKKLGEKVINYLIHKAKKEGIEKLCIETGAGEFLNLLENYLKIWFQNL